MKYTSLFCILIFTIGMGTAQSSLYTTNSKVYDEHRYGEIKGSPYLFKNWKEAIIYDDKGERIEVAALNYNGESQELELFQDGRFTILNEIEYPRISIPKHGLKGNVDKELILVSNPIKSIRSSYVQEIFKNDELSVIKSFRTVIKSVESNTPGKIIKQERFNPSSSYYIIKNDESISVKRKSENFIKVLGSDKELKSFLKKNKNKLKNDQQILELMQFYNSL